ncbi:MAG: T9SS type A sorting domain-containing protein [Bacteroidales bacterium]|jgi:hypothetical protein|nr:T9SS type A sorting domain-containing protein [Bacteroidales bacterium]
MTFNGKYLLWLAAFLLSLYDIHGQIPVGGWRDHLSWNTAEAVAVAGRKVYCSNGVGICIYDTDSRNLEKLTKTNGLSEAGVTALAYAPAAETLIVGYANGSIDLIAGKDIQHISDIRHNSVYGNRRINHIHVDGKQAYLSCGFGIVLLDLAARHTVDYYIVGDNGTPVCVHALTLHSGWLYAATDAGIKRADAQHRVLTDFEAWEKLPNIPASQSVFKAIVSHDNVLYMCDINNLLYRYEGEILSLMPFSFGTVYNMRSGNGMLLVASSQGVFACERSRQTFSGIITSLNGSAADIRDVWPDGGGYWVADNRKGLYRWVSVNEMYPVLLNGPSSNNATALRFKAGKLLAVTGGSSDDGKPLLRKGELHIFSGNQWENLQPEGLYDFTDADVDAEKPDRYYVSSWGGGIYVFENGVPTAHYDAHNSPLEASADGVTCGGLRLDDEKKLWVSNGYRAAVLDGEWKISAWKSDAPMGRFVEDTHRQIWTTQHHNGIRVFDKDAVATGQTGKTIGFAPYNYTGTTPAYEIGQIACTPDGIVWAGTNLGPVYYNNAAEILAGGFTRGYHPNRNGSEEPDFMYALLGSENTLSVTVDGAYRKWFGTENGGVFLIDEDNTGEVRHFTTANSPLLSDRIHDIAINDLTGEVFFATDYGIQSYRSDAVAAGDDFGRVYVFPNPVRPDYHGEITITGLIRDADVRITDVAGNLVHQTRTLGGQAVWNGCDYRGRRVATGVYLVFCTNNDGSKTKVTKLLFIR